VGVIVYLVRRRLRVGRAAELQAAPRSAAAIVATELYERLDAAMRGRGIGRAPGVPPLRHAEALEASGHPLAVEILALTEIYLEARFGAAELDLQDRKRFEDRVREVRVADLTPPP